MLKLKPNCEQCNKDLPPNAGDAMICSYECTFCGDCVEAVLYNVCPNCGGGFEKRPIRPSQVWRDGVSLKSQPASTEPVHSPVELDEHKTFARAIRGIPPDKR